VKSSSAKRGRHSCKTSLQQREMCRTGPGTLRSLSQGCRGMGTYPLLAKRAEKNLDREIKEDAARGGDTPGPSDEAGERGY